MSRLLLASNRLPVTVKLDKDKGELVVVPSSGGLATGLRGPHERSGGLWIGWPGDTTRMDDAQRASLGRQLDALRCVPVILSREEVSRYYDGFSNAVLWPLFHYLLDRIPANPSGWDMYRRVNERFANAIAERYQPGDLIWVHDYQLMLVPGLLRQRLPGAKIGFFLHIPFPASEVLRTLPWREPLLEGLLGADLLGFHTFTYRSHFASSVLKILGLGARGDVVRWDGRDVALGVFPMGIDTQSWAALGDDPDVRAEAEDIRRGTSGQKILVGIDRLDYTKGIPRRLLALERLLETRPHLRGKVRLVQVAVPSRDRVESYQEYKKQVDELVGRINGTYGTVDWSPIRYVYRGLAEKQVAALYRAADVMLITPLRDGMNLVAKEFVSARTDEDGALVLSEFAGAAAEMGEAVQVNPYDIAAMADAYEQALVMSEDERRFRMRALRERILARDVHEWARSFIETLEQAGDRETPSHTRASTADALEDLLAKVKAAPRLLLLLDYDGTLVPFARAPDLATPDAELVKLVTALASRPWTQVHVVSGRKKETLERWLGRLPIGLHAEHGFWSRGASPNAPWTPAREGDGAWKGQVRALLDRYRRATPGSLIEEKSAAFAWHYRMAEPELGSSRAEELFAELRPYVEREPLEIIRGEKVLEVRLRGVDKGMIVWRILGAMEPPPPTVCAMGDDATDEDMFGALPDGALSVSVGFRPSKARYRVPTPAAARALLMCLL